MNDIRAECIKTFSSIMSIDPSTVTDETSPDTVDEWDSLVHVQLIQELQKRFSIVIHPDEAVDLENFKMVEEMIKSKIANVGKS